MSFARLPINILHVLNIFILYSFFSSVDRVDGLPNDANSSSQKDCGRWSWTETLNLEIDVAPHVYTLPPVFRYKSCPGAPGSKSELPAGWERERYSHQPKTLTEAEIKYFATHSDDPSKDFEKFLDPILIVRPPGTENNTKVREFITKEMTALGWDVETHAFEEYTPLGPYKFANVIATLNPKVPRRLVFACHFDTELHNDFVFLGATDSAVPCAMLIKMAHDLKSSFDLHKNNPEAKVSFQFLFFDGEEALVKWEGNDHTYGSRALAYKWDKMPYPEKQEGEGGTTYVDRMDMLVLLDLLGAPLPCFKNFFQVTSRWYLVMCEAEEWLRANGLWEGDVNEKKYFNNKTVVGNHGVADDHMHYLQRDVPVLHTICKPFPKCWHKETNTKDFLSFPTIANLSKMFRLLAARYLHLGMGNSP